MNLHDVSMLKNTILAFKETLIVTPVMSRELERQTHEQRNSPLWFSVRRYCITASLLGAVLSHRNTTPPDSLVLRIIQPKSFCTPATYGIEKEQHAIKEYIAHQHRQGHPNLVVSPSGVIVNPKYYCLGTSPDGAVYDPSNVQQPFGFLEVKCPYPIEACGLSGFCCRLNGTT